MTKFTLEFKLAAVHSFLNGSQTHAAVAHQHGINRKSLCRWLAHWRLHGEAGLAPRPKRRLYTLSFKMEVIQYWLDTSLPLPDIAAKFNISSYLSIDRWVKLYRQGGFEALTTPPHPPRPHMPIKPKKRDTPLEEMTKEELLEELAYRRAEVAYLKKLDALIQQKKLAQQKKRR